MRAQGEVERISDRAAELEEKRRTVSEYRREKFLYYLCFCGILTVDCVCLF